MIESVENTLKEYSNSPLHIQTILTGNLLWHYTGLQGLKGIIEGKKIYASDSKFLNDSSELKYIKPLLIEVCESIGKEFGTELTDEILKFNLDDWIERNYVYVLSLSELQNSLILWSNYSNHDGYNIGLDPHELVNVFNLEHMKISKNELKAGDFVLISQGRVIYDYNLQREILTTEVKQLYSIWQGLGKLNEIINNLIICFLSRLTTYSAFFKDPRFHDEREYRIAISSNRFLKNYGGFREVNGCFVPYLCLPLESNYLFLQPIKEINIGPKNNLDIAVSGLRLFLDERGYKDTKINRSGIPLRY